MVVSVKNKIKIANTFIAAAIAGIMFFPIIWIIILSLKTENDAIRAPLEILFSAD